MFCIKSSGTYYTGSDEMSDFWSSEKDWAVKFSSSEEAESFRKRNDINGVVVEE